MFAGGAAAALAAGSRTRARACARMLAAKTLHAPRMGRGGCARRLAARSASTSAGDAGAGGGASRSSPAASTQTVTADVAIIGGGVVGAAVQLELARSGLRSIIIDKGVGVAQGSTSYSSGILRTFYSVLHTVQLSYEGFRVWQQWDDYIGAADPRGLARMRPCGGLILASPEVQPFLERTLPLHEQCGIPFEKWSLQELREFYPDMDPRLFGPPKLPDDELFAVPHESETPGGAPPMLDGAYYFPLSGYVSDPQLATLNMLFAASCERDGELAVTLAKAEMQRMVYRGGRVAGVEASTADGTVVVEAPVVVNAAGPYSRTVTERVFTPDAPAENDMRIHTRPYRVEVAHLPSMPGFDFGADGTLIMDNDIGTYARPEVGNKIVVGSQEPLCDTHLETWPEDADDYDRGLTDAWTRQVYRFLQRFPTVPLPGASETQGIVSLYDVSDDWAPIYDKSSIPGYYMAIGTSGNQFKNCGVIGRIMADIIQHEENGGDHDAEPVQMELPLTRNTMDTRHFSRLRTKLATSGSVLG